MVIQCIRAIMMYSCFNCTLPYTRCSCKASSGGCKLPANRAISLVFIKALRATKIKHITGNFAEFHKKYLNNNICFYAHRGSLSRVFFILPFLPSNSFFCHVFLLELMLIITSSEREESPTKYRKGRGFSMT